MKNYIACNTLCADGRNIADKRSMAFLEHKNNEWVHLRKLELAHLTTCPVCNPDLRVDAMVQALWPGARVAE